MIAFGMYMQNASADLDVIEDVGSGMLGVTGTQDSSNTDFTLSAVPSATNLIVVRNGLIQKSGVDFTLAGSTLTFVVPPASDDILLAIAIGGE